MTLRQGTTAQIAGHQLPGTTAMRPGQDMAAEQALLAEARPAHGDGDGDGDGGRRSRWH